MALNQSQQSAYNIVSEVLRQYGLEQLESFVNNYIARFDTVDPDSLMVEIRQQPAYQQRFAGNEARRKAGKTVLSESEYLALERGYEQLLRVSGLPTGFYDSPEDFRKFIENDVSVSELNARVEQGYQAVRMANPEVVKQMNDLYGVSEGQLAAYFLDPTRSVPEITRQAQAATIAAQGRLLAGQQLTAAQAEGLAQAGVGEEQARTGFAAIQQTQGLFAGTLEEGENISQEEQLGAIFGTNAAAQQRVRQRARRRQAQFEQGGGFASGEEGSLAGVQ